LKTTRHQSFSRPALSRLSGRSPSGMAKAGEIVRLRARLAEADATLRALLGGDVDSVVVPGKHGDRVFTLHGAEHAYRVLIESMNEGALALTSDKMILYANQCFARMVKCPLEQVTGSSFRRFLSEGDRAMLRPLMKRVAQSGAKIQVLLKVSDGSQLPAQISLRPLARNGINRATIGMVVTDLTESRRTEELLRALTHRVVQVQEAERGRVALELHDNITQLLCAVLFRSQALADNLAGRAGPARREAVKLREMLGQAAGEVERITRNLRPGALDQLGLVDALRDTSREFANRTGASVKLTCVELVARLPADTELTLYRILQEALQNVERHACARHVTVCLSLAGAFVQLAITDDGIGFDATHHAARRKAKGVLGLLGMHERATSVDGVLTVKSGRRAGTKIEVRIPLPPTATAAD
jgi:two-component system NarL family sensor kinase